MSANAFGRKPVQDATRAGLALERHYSVAGIARMWAFSEHTVRGRRRRRRPASGNTCPPTSAATEPSVSRRAFSLAFIESANCGGVEASASAPECDRLYRAESKEVT